MGEDGLVSFQDAEEAMTKFNTTLAEAFFVDASKCPERLSGCIGAECPRWCGAWRFVRGEVLYKWIACKRTFTPGE